MPVEVSAITRWMEQFAPARLAEPEDPIGLQLGAPDRSVSKVAVTLEVTEAVAEEAMKRGAELIISHHPIIFRPLQALRTDRPDGRLMEKLLRNGQSVYVAHTNLDVAKGGVNDMLAVALGLLEAVPLRPSVAEALYKLAVFVPMEHEEAVKEAMFHAGAGWIGEYKHCSFTTEGTGSFLPLEGATPFLGAVGRVEKVREVKVETIVPEEKKEAVIRALISAHPYEEPAYDVYRLELEGERMGLGRIGALPRTVSLREFSGHVKQVLNVPYVRVVGNPDKDIRKVAVLGGSGRSFWKQALASGADAYVTGDIDHHTAHDALAAGLAIVDPGHHVEEIMKEGVARRLNDWFRENGMDAEAYASPVRTEPFAFM